MKCDTDVCWCLKDECYWFWWVQTFQSRRTIIIKSLLPITCKLRLSRKRQTLLFFLYITSQLNSGTDSSYVPDANYCASIVSLTLMVLSSLNKPIMSLCLSGIGQNLAWIITNESNIMLLYISYVIMEWWWVLMVYGTECNLYFITGVCQKKWGCEPVHSSAES